MTGFLKSEGYKKYAKVLSGVIDTKIQQLVRSRSDEATRALQIEIQAFTWLRDQLPDLLVQQEEDEAMQPPVHGSEYDAKKEATLAPEDGGYGPPESTRRDVSHPVSQRG